MKPELTYLATNAGVSSKKSGLAFRILAYKICLQQGEKICQLQELYSTVLNVAVLGQNAPQPRPGENAGSDHGTLWERLWALDRKENAKTTFQLVAMEMGGGCLLDKSR